tara:strand:- start:475 stop:783 length:309 start_codon:yes stop_codon:yes gene_type:complete
MDLNIAFICFISVCLLIIVVLVLDYSFSNTFFISVAVCLEIVSSVDSLMYAIVHSAVSFGSRISKMLSVRFVIVVPKQVLNAMNFSVTFDSLSSIVIVFPQF